MLELVTSYRGCEIHQDTLTQTFHVFEIGESPKTAEPYAVVNSRVEADMVVDSLASLYVAVQTDKVFRLLLDELN